MKVQESDSGLLFTVFEPVTEAVLSPDEKYRYSLTRTWNPTLPLLAWIMLNPSTADATKNDPTINKCIGYATRWGFGGITVVNLFAYRATDPRELAKVRDPFGPDNDEWVIRETHGRMVIAAWGASIPTYWRPQIADFVAGLRRANIRLHHLGLTKDGHPRHPLYLRGDTMPQPWKEAA